jgi:hypothetical protein
MGRVVGSVAGGCTNTERVLEVMFNGTVIAEAGATTHITKSRVKDPEKMGHHEVDQEGGGGVGFVFRPSKKPSSHILCMPPLSMKHLETRRVDLRPQSTVHAPQVPHLYVATTNLAQVGFGGWVIIKMCYRPGKSVDINLNDLEGGCRMPPGWAQENR